MTGKKSKDRPAPAGRRRRVGSGRGFPERRHGFENGWWLPLLICLGLAGAAMAAFDPMPAGDSQESMSVEAVAYATTPAAVLTPPDVTPWPLMERFVPLAAGQLQTGLGSRAHWLKVDVRNPTDQGVSRCLNVGVVSHADIRVFVAPSSGAADARWRELPSAGAAREKASAADRLCADLPLTQWWPLSVGPRQSLTVLIRARVMQPTTLRPGLVSPAFAQAAAAKAERLSLGVAVLAGFGMAVMLIWAAVFSRARHLALAGNALALFFWVGMLDGSLAARFLTGLSLQIAPYGSGMAGVAFAVTYVMSHGLLAAKDGQREALALAGKVLVGILGGLLLLVLFIGAWEFVALLWILVAIAPLLTLVHSWIRWHRRATGSTGMLWAHALLQGVYAWQLHGLLGFAGLPRMAPEVHLVWMAGVLLHHLVWTRLLDAEVPRESESESRNSLARLEEEVEKRTEDLRIAREGAERMAALQRDFLATMSHELRTPMASVVGLCRMLGSDQALPERARNDMGTIERLAVHLLRMVDDGLAYVRQRGKEEPVARKPVNMRFLLRDMESVARWLSQRQDNEFIMLKVRGMPPVLHFDERRLRQVLINLVSNAGRYCHNGQVTLGVTFSMTDNTPALSWSISDSGRGMSPEEVQKVFEPFVKSRDSQGLGLGLALVRKLIDDMGGAIRVQSQIGVGTHFHISIPVGVEGESLEGMRLDNIAEIHPDDALISRPMALLSDRELGLLRLENLRDHLRLGRLSEIEEWIAGVDDSSEFSPEARRFMRKVRQAAINVDLATIGSLVDQIDPPLKGG